MLRKITALFYDFRFLRKFSIFIRRYHAANSFNFAIDDFDGDLKYFGTTSEHISSQIYWYGYYSKDLLELTWKNVDDDKAVFFDVGANKGLFTLYLAKRLRNGQIYSFEPSKTNLLSLYKNIQANNFKNVQVIEKGLSDKTEIVEIYKPKNIGKDGTYNEGEISIYKNGNNTVSDGQVELIKLDDFVANANIQRLDFIKIDIEGAELKMLHGAKKTLETYKPKILIECNKNTMKVAGYSGTDIFDFLTGIGYIFYSTLNNKMSQVNRDTLAIHRDLLCIIS